MEIDYTFYRMPNARTIAAWRGASPPGFRFALKASRRITHFERLRLPSDALGYLTDVVLGLEDRLGVLLFQLPPNFARDDERLERFLAEIPPGLPRAFELRHASWLNSEVYALLRRYRAALCIQDGDEGTTPLEVTGPLVYLRLRRTAYSAADLSRWAGHLRELVASGLDVYAFVKHEGSPEAPQIALRLTEMVRSPR